MNKYTRNLLIFVIASLFILTFVSGKIFLSSMSSPVQNNIKTPTNLTPTMLIDSTNEGSSSGIHVLAVPLTVGISGGRSKLIVQVANINSAETNLTPINITYNNIALTQAVSVYNPTSKHYTAIWYLDDPSNGTHYCIMTLPAISPDNRTLTMAVTSIFGAETGTPEDNQFYQGSGVIDSTLNFASVNGSWIFDSISVSTTSFLTPGSGQTTNLNQNSGLQLGSYKQNVNPSTRHMFWDFGSVPDNVAHVGISIKQMVNDHV